MKVFGGGDPGGRAILTKYYAFIQRLTSSPSFLRWIEKGLEGDPVDREAVRRAILQGQKAGMLVGGAAGESIYNNTDPKRQTAQ